MVQELTAVAVCAALPIDFEEALFFGSTTRCIHTALCIAPWCKCKKSAGRSLPDELIEKYEGD